MVFRRARLYDALALLTVFVVVALDQWTKSFVVEALSPPQSKPFMPLIGQYLGLYYVQNSGAAFSLLRDNAILILFIVAAIAVVAYLYMRMLNSGSLAYKMIFGMIIGGAAGNLLDRVRHGGFVVDFISFRIPEIGYQFAIFNVADACISVSVFLLFVLLLFGGLPFSGDAAQQRSAAQKASGTLRPTERDAQP
ncbi:MAG: signal peptidase II [Chloroflexi bacterium]|nr:MAG: signal peptidase II [Chloroflexota bacterium]